MTTRAIAPLALLLALPACVASVGGDRGPAGPPGPMGPRGSEYARPLFATGDVALAPDTDVVVARAALTVALPPASQAGMGRLVTVRAAAGAVRIVAAGADVIEGRPMLALKSGEMATLMSDGGASWVVVSISDL